MSRSRGPVAGLDIVTLVRGYPPVLGAMLLVDGVLTLILGGDATVSLGEVFAYLLLPPLAMFLLTQLTGGRRPSAVTLGVGVGGAAVLFAALFLLGDVHLVTLPGWLLALFGLLLLGVAVVLMRRAAPAREEPAVPPLLNRDERTSFSHSDDDLDFGTGSRAARDDFGSHSAAEGADYGSRSGAGAADYDARAADFGSRSGAAPADYGAAPADFGSHSGAAPADFGAAPADYGARAADFGSRPGGYDRPAESEWPPHRDDEQSRPYSATRAADDTVPGLPRVPADPAPGPSEPEWPPRRDPQGSRPTWDDRDDARDWSTGNGTGAGTGAAWSDGPADREWPPSSPARDWPRRDVEPGPAAGPAPDAAAGPRSWFESDEAAPSEAQPAEPTWQPGPPDSEWPPADRTYPSGGRRSRHPEQ